MTECVIRTQCAGFPVVQKGLIRGSLHRVRPVADQQATATALPVSPVDAGVRFCLRHQFQNLELTHMRIPPGKVPPKRLGNGRHDVRDRAARGETRK